MDLAWTAVAVAAVLITALTILGMLD